MTIQINGQEKAFPEAPHPFTLAALVEILGMKADRVAIELNRDIVPRDRWAETRLKEAIGWNWCTSWVAVAHPGTGNFLSHPIFTESLLDSPRLAPKMFETFCLEIVSNKFEASCKTASHRKK